MDRSSGRTTRAGDATVRSCNRPRLRATGRDRHGVVPSPQCRHDALGLQCTIAQRVDEAGGGDAAPGCGNGESAGSLAPFGGFGFLGSCVMVLAALGGGPAGFSSAKPGLGSAVVVAGVGESTGLRITWTGIVADCIW